MKNFDRLLFTAIVPLAFISCKGGASKAKQDTVAKDMPHVAKTMTQIMAAKPIFNGYDFYELYTADTTYIRSVSNTKSLKKVWIVYYDQTIDNWTVKTWIGSGENNKVFGDTVWTRKSGNVIVPDSIRHVIYFYMASSTDGGKTWKSYHMSPASLYCKGNPRLSDVQLLVSNDFINTQHIPSLGIMIQWKNLYATDGNDITARFDFSNYCAVMRKLPFYQN